MVKKSLMVLACLVAFLPAIGFATPVCSSLKQCHTLAKQKNAEAQYQLALYYYEGKDNVTQNYHKAKKWFEESAKQGYALSQYYLGRMYYYGQGVKQNYEEAQHWFKEAADANIAKAQYYMGVCYYHGQGVIKNLETAKEWFKKSADQGYDQAKKYLQSIVGN